MRKLKGISPSLWTEIVSSIAVIIGLVFVGYELNQNTKSQMVSNTQALSKDYREALIPALNNKENSCIYIRGINDLSALDQSEVIRFYGMMFQIYRAAEQLHYYAGEGMVDDSIWQGFERQFQEVSLLPGVQAWWADRSDWFSDDFQAFVGGLMANKGATDPTTFQGVTGC